MFDWGGGGWSTRVGGSGERKRIGGSGGEKESKFQIYNGLFKLKYQQNIENTFIFFATKGGGGVISPP